MAPDVDIALEHFRAGRLTEALEGARSAARSSSPDGRALAVWGMAAAELGRWAEAIEPLKAAAARARDPSTYAGVMVPLARALSALGLWAEAERAASAAERAGVASPEERDRLGATLFRIGLVERALPHFEAAALASPQRADFQRDLAMALVAGGRLEEAQAALERAIALDPVFGVAHMTLADIRRWDPQTAHLDRLRGLWANPATPPSELPANGFALFKELDDLGLTDEAWPVLERANALARAMEGGWDETAEIARVEALIRAFPRERFTGQLAKAGDRPRPIFILGLPRSGTTLVERILTAHSEVAAMGELVAFPLLFEQAFAAGPIDWPALARAYRRETAYLWNGAANVIDKQPRNSAHAGALRLAFPDAVIVHLRRDPMDGLLGAYKVLFHGAYHWSYRLQDLAAHHRLHTRLMDHWRACLGEGLIELDYEALTREPEAQIRRLLDACGLEFEAACLHPEKAPGAVATASSAQVRSPITSARIGAWRRYAAQLEPLRAALDAG